jgi:uncharacterized zinc-type alcohol dehydrogenase-like protein
MEILYCGVCHSDLHMVRNEWHNTVYPCVPGHEIVGRVSGLVASERNSRKVIWLPSVAWWIPAGLVLVASAGLEQYCERGPVLTYNSEDTHLGGVTYGGYSKAIVVDDAFVLRVSEKLEPCGGCAAAVCRHNNLFAAAPAGKWARDRKSASLVSGDLATWR